MISVSDHGLIRFLDRAIGVDTEGLRNLIGARLEKASKAAGTLGTGDFTVKADGVAYVVKGGVLVTVLAREMRATPREDGE